MKKYTIEESNEMIDDPWTFFRSVNPSRAFNGKLASVHEEWMIANVLSKGWVNGKTWFYCGGDKTKARFCPCGKMVKVPPSGFGYTVSSNYCSRRCSRKNSHMKAAENNMRKYGVKTTLQLKEVRDKITSTLLAKYGTTKPQETQEVKEKTRKTCLERYGAPSYVESEHGKAKISKMVAEKYGVSTPLQSSVVQKKCRETLFKNYGVSSPLKSKEIYERVKKTNFERYGTEFIGSAMSDAISEGHRKHWSNVIGEDAYSRLRDRDLMEYQYRTFGVVWMVGEYGVSDVLIYRRLHELGINTDSNTTKIEKDVAAMLEDAGFEFFKNDRTILDGLEIDIYIPEYKIGIECNGEYWHASNSDYSHAKEKGYHYQKFLLAKSKGIRLFQFWGFEIIETPEDVLETIEKAKNGFKPDAERGFIKIDNMKPFIIDGNLCHLEEPKMTVWNGLELWDAGTSYFLSK